MGRIKGMKHKSDLRQAVLTTFFAELKRHRCIWKPQLKANSTELYEERCESWRVIMERLKQTYSPEILAVMKMSNIEGLKQHYRCHKDKRAKTIKTMASVTDPARLVRLQSCLDKRMEFLDERGMEEGATDTEETSNEMPTDSVPKEEEPVEDEPPPSKQLRLSDFKEPPPPPTISPSSKDHSIDQDVYNVVAPEYDANTIQAGEAVEDDDSFLNDFIPPPGRGDSGPKDKVHHFFEFLKAEVRELPKSRQLMIMDSFFIQLTEARKWN